ncbi:flippase [Flexistipes sp.]|uniref:flippase n=1 Tax=Flexistipes sp. TaxID=3088135 RepID=UPI002E22753A|nr:flippase [Flexistipes sp.]
MQSVKEYVIRGASGIFLMKIIGIFIGLLSSIVIARAMGPENYGLYSFALETMMFVSIPISMGLANLLTREVAKYHYQNNFSYLKGIIAWSGKFVFFTALLLILIAAIGIFVFIDDPVKMNIFLLALPIIFLNSINQVRMGSLRGLKRVIQSQLPETLIRPSFTVIVISLLYWGMKYPISAKIGIIVNLFSLSIVFIVGLWWLLKAVPEKSKITVSAYDSKKWIRESMPFFLLGGIAIINTKLSVVIVGVFRPVEEVGFYRIAVTASTIISFLLMAVNMTIAPLISELYYGGKKDQLQRILTKTVRFIFTIGLMISIGYWVLGNFLISLFYGHEYLPAYLPLVILSLGQLINIGAGSVGIVLNMTGYQNDTVKGQVIAAISSVALNILLVPKYGLNGAAVATAGSFLIWNIVLLYFVKKRTKLKTSVI